MCLQISNQGKQRTELAVTRKYKHILQAKNKLGEQIRHSYIFNVVEIRWHGELSKETNSFNLLPHSAAFHSFPTQTTMMPTYITRIYWFLTIFSYPSLCTNMKKQEAEVDKMYSKIFPHFNIALQERINYG